MFVDLRIRVLRVFFSNGTNSVTIGLHVPAPGLVSCYALWEWKLFETSTVSVFVMF